MCGSLARLGLGVASGDGEPIRSVCAIDGSGRSEVQTSHVMGAGRSGDTAKMCAEDEGSIIVVVEAAVEMMDFQVRLVVVRLCDVTVAMPQDHCDGLAALVACCATRKRWFICALARMDRTSVSGKCWMS